MDANGSVDFELGVSPSGRVHLAAAAFESPGESKTAQAFVKSDVAGLFLLGAQDAPAGLSATCACWRDFAALYLRELCQTPESEQGNLAPMDAPLDTLAELADRAPPMEGGEYIQAELLADIWRRLDDHVRDRATQFPSGLTGLLDRHAPRWRGVGRVFFHLAENKRDPNAPFAFLATYAGDVSAAGRVQHQPLSKALTQYAEAKNKKTLQRILAPVHEAAKRSKLVQTLVESSDIFRPLAWTPREAHRFLQEVPLLEEADVLVRLPDWWKKTTATPSARIDRRAAAEQHRAEFNARFQRNRRPRRA